MSRSVTGITVVCLMGVLCLMGASAERIPNAAKSITEIFLLPKTSVFENSAWNQPIVIKSIEDAKKSLGSDALKTLAKSVDFQKQFVLVFAWQGSGGDELTYKILKSFPEQIVFSRKAGLTRDLRSHARVFALRSGVRWSVQDKSR